MIEITIKPGDHFDKSLRRWTKICEKSGVLSDVRTRQRYEKPTEVHKKHKNLVKKRNQRELAMKKVVKLY